MEGVFPSYLKLSKVIPIYKSKEPSDPNNYRPISLLPIVSKIVESLMLKRMNSFLDKFNVIDKSQHGFRKGYSKTSAAFEYLEEVYEFLDQRKKSLGLFIDFSKASDLVDHQILLGKLGRLCFRGVTNQWFKPYPGGWMSNRPNRAVGCKSGPDDLNHAT
jgi:hypothetical protein